MLLGNNTFDKEAAVEQIEEARLEGVQMQNEGEAEGVTPTQTPITSRSTDGEDSSDFGNPVKKKKSSSSEVWSHYTK